MSTTGSAPPASTATADPMGEPASTPEGLEAQIRALEASQAELHTTSQATISENLAQISTLDRALAQRTRFAKAQRVKSAKRSMQPNVVAAGQEKALDGEINELRRRRDAARDANGRTDRKLATLADERQRLVKQLKRPPSRPASASAASLIGGGSRARPASAKSASVASLSSVHELPVEVRLEDAETRLAAARAAQLTHQHMAARLRKERSSFDARFAAAQGELVRERKRVSTLRVASTEAVQARRYAEEERRRTEKRVALQQAAEKRQLSEQQAELMSTQASVLQLELSRISRHESSARIVGERPASAAREGAAGGGETGEQRQRRVWEGVQSAMGVNEPIELIHKVFEQQASRGNIVRLEGQADAALGNAAEEEAALKARREAVHAAAGEAAARRLERLQEAVASAQEDIADRVARRDAAAELVQQTRTALCRLAKLAPPLPSGPTEPTPEGCAEEELPDALQLVADALLIAWEDGDEEEAAAV